MRDKNRNHKNNSRRSNNESSSSFPNKSFHKKEDRKLISDPNSKKTSYRNKSNERNSEERTTQQDDPFKRDDRERKKRSFNQIDFRHRESRNLEETADNHQRKQLHSSNRKFSADKRDDKGKDRQENYSKGGRSGAYKNTKGREERFVDSSRKITNKASKGFEKLDDEKMPLNKFIAHAGICSRRDAVNLIKNGEIKINDQVIKEPGFKVNQEDKVYWNDRRVYLQEKLVYILLNKPKGYITTTDDPKGRRTVMDIFRYQIEERIYPVGRLDRNTTGLLILTNDGQLTQKLAHPKYEVKKVYQVSLDKAISSQDLAQIKKGLVLEDGPIEVDQIEVLEEATSVGIEIHSGRNRIVRRIFESLGYEVIHLDRVMYADLTKKNLPRGKWRMLSKQEVINLKFIK